MPIYEFECPKCYKRWEVLFLSPEDNPIMECPKCGEPSEKIISPSNFHLKGDGWYKQVKPPKKEKK